jgi:hypothetical protein
LYILPLFQQDLSQIQTVHNLHHHYLSSHSTRSELLHRLSSHNIRPQRLHHLLPAALEQRIYIASSLQAQNLSITLSLSQCVRFKFDKCHDLSSHITKSVHPHSTASYPFSFFFFYSSLFISFLAGPFYFFMDRICHETELCGRLSPFIATALALLRPLSTLSSLRSLRETKRRTTERREGIIQFAGFFGSSSTYNKK